MNFEVREYDDTKLNKEFRFNPAIVVALIKEESGQAKKSLSPFQLLAF